MFHSLALAATVFSNLPERVLRTQEAIGSWQDFDPWPAYRFDPDDLLPILEPPPLPDA